MSDYMIKCMPFMNLHIDDGEDKINTGARIIIFLYKKKRYIYRLSC